MNKKRIWTGLLIGAVCLFWTNTPRLQAKADWPEGTEIEGETAIVMEASTGTVLYRKNPNARRYPASITKIMTALLAIENSSLTEEVVFSEDAVHKTEGSGIDREAGEKMTMEDCLYGMMLESANECAYAIAEHVGGDYETFIKMMNERAKELGCQNTHFTNPHGLPDEKHTTCVYDMALISREALKNKTFLTVAGTKSHTIPPTNKHKKKTELRNTHQMLDDYRGAQHLYKGCIGGKTGYTEAARNTLVTFAKRDGMTLICVVLDEGLTKQYSDTRLLLDDCFEHFKVWNVSKNERSDIRDQIQTRYGGNGNDLPMLDKNGLVVLPKTAEFADASAEIIEDRTHEGKMGVLQYTYAKRKVGGADIAIANTAIPVIGALGMQLVLQKKTEKETWGVILLAALAVLILGLGIYLLRNKAGYQRRYMQKRKRYRKLYGKSYRKNSVRKRRKGVRGKNRR